MAFAFNFLDHGPFSIFILMDSFVSPFWYIFLITDLKSASNPYSESADAIAPATKSVMTPPIIPPGPRSASAAVIAAAPYSPVIDIATINMIPGTPIDTIFFYDFVHNHLFLLFLSLLFLIHLLTRYVPESIANSLTVALISTGPPIIIIGNMVLDFMFLIFTILINPISDSSSSQSPSDDRNST